MVVADGERDVGAVAVGGGEDGDVRADAPVARDLQTPGQPPVVAGDRTVRGQRRGLDDARQTGAGGDLRGAVTAVVADAVDVDGELLGRVDRDVEVDGLAGGHRAGGDEAFDLPVDVVGGAGARGGSGGGDPGGAGLRAVGAGGVVSVVGAVGAVGRVRVHVPGDDLAGVAEVRLGAAQPGDRALAEGVRHGVRECSRLPAADLLRPHGGSPPSRPRTPVPVPVPVPGLRPCLSCGVSPCHVLDRSQHITLRTQAVTIRCELAVSGIRGSGTPAHRQVTVRRGGPVSPGVSPT